MPALLDKPKTERDTLLAQPESGTDGPSSVIPPGEEQKFGVHTAIASDFLDMEIDEANMYVAPLPIVNSSEDRDGEVTDPDGLIDTAYRSNPVVFLNHSHKFDPMLPPIGTAETPDRKYDVHRTAGGWDAGTRFSQRTKFAEQAFALVADGVLRARSIGALNHGLAPYTPKAAGKTFHEGRIVDVRTRSVTHTLYELVEFSWVWIPSNREMVVGVKSILSRNAIDGRPLDGGLRMLLKGFSAVEPTSNAAKSNGRYAKQHDRIFSKFLAPEGAMNDRLVAVRFSTKHFSPDQALQKLRLNESMKETDLVTEQVNGDVFLKSVQTPYRSHSRIATDPRIPGIELLFAKATSLTKEAPDEEEQEADGGEANVVEQIIEEADKVSVQEGSEGQDQSQGAPEQREAPQAEGEAVVVDDEKTPMKKGPIGAKYLTNFAMKLSEIADLADASTDELEPEMMEKCGEFSGALRKFIDEVKAYHAERYGGGDEDGEEKKKESLTEEDAAMQKSLRADLFFGRRRALPSSFVKSVQLARKKLNGVHGTEDARKTLELVTKGLASLQQRQRHVSEDDERKELEEQIRQRMRQLTEKGDLSEIS